MARGERARQAGWYQAGHSSHPAQAHHNTYLAQIGRLYKTAFRQRQKICGIGSYQVLGAGFLAVAVESGVGRALNQAWVGALARTGLLRFTPVNLSFLLFFLLPLFEGKLLGNRINFLWYGFRLNHSPQLLHSYWSVRVRLETGDWSPGQGRAVDLGLGAGCKTDWFCTACAQLAGRAGRAQLTRFRLWPGLALDRDLLLAKVYRTI